MGRRRLLQVLFELGRPLSGSVFAKHPAASTPGDFKSFLFAGRLENMQYLVGVLGDDDFPADLKKHAQPIPVVADNRCTTRRHLEQPDAWAVTSTSHVA